MEIGPVARPGPVVAPPAARMASGAAAVEMPEVAVRQPALVARSEDRPSAQAVGLDRRVAVEVATWELIDRSSHPMRRLAERAVLRMRAYARRRDGADRPSDAGSDEVV